MIVRRVGASVAWRANSTRWRILESVSGARRSATPTSVALTFDDGPHPGSTDQLLDILSECAAKATFFCVGSNALRHPQLTRRIEAEGHRVGSHSLTHPHPAQMPLRALASDYSAGRQALEEVLGHEVALFRPPHGHLNFAQAALLRRQRFHSWLWDVDPQDWIPNVSAQSITSLVSNRAVPGSVVLLHDWVEQPMSLAATDRTATLEAVPIIVRNLRARGLSFSRLP